MKGFLQKFKGRGHMRRKKGESVVNKIEERSEHVAEVAAGLDKKEQQRN